MSEAARLAIAAVCLIAGLVVGLCSVALHQRWWGLPLGIAATAALAIALPPGWWARMPFAFGWVAMIGYLALGRDEGDIVIEGDVEGYALLGFAVALLISATVTLQPLRRGNPTDERPPT